MHQAEISAALADLPLGGLRFFSTIGSTNDEALAWVATGAHDLSIVVADEQTAGRGRAGRKWFTPRGSALAVSLILRPTPVERTLPARITGLAALALIQCCRELRLQALIKWPNDILVQGRKVAGILVESAWAGNQLDASVLGIGVNVAAAAVPPIEQLAFPATSLETELGHAVDRLKLVRSLLAAIIRWRAQIGGPEFLSAWEEGLAFRGEQVTVGREGEPPLNGTLHGLEADGSLRMMADNIPAVVHFGEIHLRPSNDKIR